MTANTSTKKWGWLPEIGTKRYYALLISLAILVLGPLGGITAAYMNFSLGFFVGGQVLAGILGSTITFGYGAEGRHGANYMQTCAASVAGMSAMAVLIQAMTWLGLPEPPAWQLIAFFTCIGMFGVGIGMLYTPLLVDKMKLTYPSGLAVANILRALTDLRLLKRSIKQLSSGTIIGLGIPLAALKRPIIDTIGISTSTIGAGMIVGARIGLAGATVGVAGKLLTPYLVSIHWLNTGESFRKIGFIIALGTIMGAAIVDLVQIFIKFAQQLMQKQPQPVEEQADWQKTNIRRLILWVVCWGLALIFVATHVLHTPVLFVLVAIALAFIFVLVNGIATGISDSNPISSAFVVTVFILAALGLKDAGVGLLAAGILLISTSSGVDMQQDRSTGWRLGTNRTIQFRFQVIGIAMGAVMSVMIARIFMKAYPILRANQYVHQHLNGTEKWGSAMTFKFVGALESLTHPQPHVIVALWLGIFLGIIVAVLRKMAKDSASYKSFVASGKVGFATDFLVDSIILPSPYASSFGGFLELQPVLWFAAGGCLSSVVQTLSDHLKKGKPVRPEDEGLPEDMSVMSLVGGGLIAGDSLAGLGIGLYGLLSQLL